MAQQPLKSFDRPLKRVSLSYSISVILILVGLGGLGVMCSLRDPRFPGSNPVEVDHKSSGRDFKQGVSSLRF